MNGLDRLLGLIALDEAGGRRGGEEEWRAALRRADAPPFPDVAEPGTAAAPRRRLHGPRIALPIHPERVFARFARR